MVSRLKHESSCVPGEVIQTEGQKETDRWTAIDIQMDRKRDRGAEKETDRWTEKGTDSGTENEKDSWTTGLKRTANENVIFKVSPINS